MNGKKGTPQEGTLVLGLGNPILSDDGVGFLVASAVEEALDGCPHAEVRRASVAGFDLLDLLSGFERVIIVDAIQTGGSPGSVFRLEPGALPTPERLGTMHEINLPTALALGRMLGMHMPRDVVIYAVEVQDARTFGETCTPEVEGAVDTVAALILADLRLSGAIQRGIPAPQETSRLPQLKSQASAPTAPSR